MKNKILQISQDTKLVYQNELIELWNNARTRSIFNHPSWYKAVIESGIDSRNYNFIYIKQNGQLIFFWPLVVNRKFRDLFSKSISPLGESKADYISPLICSSLTDDDIRYITDILVNKIGKHTVLRFPKLIDNSIIKNILEYKNIYTTTITHDICKRLRCSETYEETEKSWGKSHRPTVRRKVKKYKNAGGQNIWIAKSRDQVIDRLPLFFEIHSEKWTSASKNAEFNELIQRRYFLKLAELLPFERLHYSELRLGNALLSAHLGFINEKWLYWYKPAYNVQYSEYSPGLLHIAYLVNTCINEGLQGIDFLQGDDEYKARWSNEEVSTTSIEMLTLTKSKQSLLQISKRVKRRILRVSDR